VELQRLSQGVTHSSFGADDFRIGGVFFNFRSDAEDILLEKFTVSLIIWPPDIVE